MQKLTEMGILEASKDEIQELAVGLACKCSEMAKVASTAQNMQDCLEEAVRSAMGVTLLSEYGQIPPDYQKKAEPLVASSKADISNIVQLRVVTSVMRTIARRGILTTTNTNELAKEIYSSVAKMDSGMFVFEYTVYDDYACLQNILYLLAERMLDFKNSTTFTMLWIGMNEFVFRHYQHWGVSPPRDERAGRWLEMLDGYARMPDGRDKVLQVVQACLSPEQMASIVFVQGNQDRNRAVGRFLDMLYPGVSGGPFKSTFRAHHVPDAGYLEMPENILDLCMLTESVLQNAPQPCKAATQTVVREFVARLVLFVLMWGCSGG